MEDRFEKICCPNCGQEMHKGVTGVSYNQVLAWLPGRTLPGIWDQQKIMHSREGGNMEIGKRFTSRFRLKGSVFPAWYCDSCALMTVDTKTELEEV